jgi:hypothetical protein
MKALGLFIFLTSLAAHAGSDKLNQNGIYEGVNPLRKESCTVTVTNVKRSLISKDLISATVTSSIFKNREAVKITCVKYDLGASLNCSGLNSLNQTIILGTTQVNDLKPYLVILNETQSDKSISCDDLVLSQNI